MAETTEVVAAIKRVRPGITVILGGPEVSYETEQQAIVQMWEMRYNPHAPYDVLQTRLIDFATMQRLRRFARCWDLVANSGNFVETTPRLWNEPSAQGASPSPLRGERAGVRGENVSPFAAFLRFTDWLYARVGRTDSIALARLAELLFDFLTMELGDETKTIAASIERDWQRAGRRDLPEFLRASRPARPDPIANAVRSTTPKRQARHLGSTN